MSGDGEWKALSIDGVVVAQKSRGVPAAAVAGGSVAAVLLALLFEGPRALLLRIGLGFYTRLSREDLLAHPRRAAIHAHVRDQPGIHLRELHRKVGGGWGIFRAHFDLLSRAGYLRTEPQGKYVAVYLADANPASPTIPSEIAREAYAALPADGTAVPVASLRVGSQVSRQLFNYHVSELARRGLVRIEQSADGARTIARASPTPESDRT